jgi:hypothetical protein
MTRVYGTQQKWGNKFWICALICPVDQIVSKDCVEFRAISGFTKKLRRKSAKLPHYNVMMDQSLARNINSYLTQHPFGLINRERINPASALSCFQIRVTRFGSRSR